MGNIKSIPFSEIVERVQDLSRSSADVKQRIRGIVNEVYYLDIPRERDWKFLKGSTSYAMIAKYDTGYATVTTQGTIVTFQSGAVITATMTGRRIKFTSNPDIYNFTYASPSNGTISPSLSGSANISSGSYVIFDNLITLPDNFGRFPVNGGILFYESGQPRQIPEKVDDDHYAEANYSPSSVPDYCRAYEYDTAGNMRFEIMPPPSTSYMLPCEFIKALKPMKESTAGVVIANSGTTVVTGSIGSVFTQMTTGDYLRLDGFGKGPDSTWYRITSITNDTTLNVTPAFRTDSSYTGSYTISSVPEMPYHIHDAIIYGAVTKLLPDQNDPMFIASRSNYAKILTDNKVLEQSRYAKDNVELLAEDIEYRR